MKIYKHIKLFPLLFLLMLLTLNSNISIAAVSGRLEYNSVLFDYSKLNFSSIKKEADKKATEEEYREALEIWKKENPDKEYKDISSNTVVEINGKQIKIGKRIDNMKRNLDKLDEDTRRYWESKGVLENKRLMVTEDEYREALEIWKRENPDKEYRDIPQKAVVEVNGKKIRIGVRISTMKLYLDQLDDYSCFMFDEDTKNKSILKTKEDYVARKK